MIRFVLIFILAFSVTLFITYHAHDMATPFFKEVLSGFVVVTMIIGALSYSLFAYADGILKDVSADKKIEKSDRYNVAISSLSGLKKEILVNAFAVVGLLVIEIVAHGFSKLLPVNGLAQFSWSWATTTSIRMACFTSSVYIAVIQFHAFIIASDYRAIISQK